jgi:hypothetical protein
MIQHGRATRGCIATDFINSTSQTVRSKELIFFGSTLPPVIVKKKAPNEMMALFSIASMETNLHGEK